MARMVKESSGKALLDVEIDISNLDELTQDAKKATLNGDTGPEDPTDYNMLRGRLEACRDKLPPKYRDAAYKPFVNTLNEQGRDGFIEILLNRPDEKFVMMDIAQAILQHSEGFDKRETGAFQEVISDLYDGFLSAEDRKDVKIPDNKEVIPPLCKWGNPDEGPYTCPIDATSSFGLAVGTVNLPPANAKLGLVAWSALGHETAGHDVIHADDGLAEEMTNAVRKALQDASMGEVLPDYWADRIDETASDVCGILNMGPAVGIGLISYFRGLGLAYTGEQKLRNIGPLNDVHPADIIRGYLAASVVRKLSFKGAEKWAKLIESETNKDLDEIRLNVESTVDGRLIPNSGTVISPDDAKKSAEIVAATLVQGKMEHLDKHAFIDIQDWADQDESIVENFRKMLVQLTPLPDNFAKGLYAAHVVAAAVMEALSNGADIPMIFERMMTILKIMHDTNPSWGPLYVRHRGDLARERGYIPYKL